MFKPDFLIIPYQIKANPALRPSDGDVYAAVYWLERLSVGKCIASNESLADIACCGIRNVKAALDRLEQEGYIIRTYRDPESRIHRKEIKTLLQYQKIDPGVVARKPAKEIKSSTPAENARLFFQDEAGLVDKIINRITELSGQTEEVVKAEVQNFTRYWTELNKSGTKQRWELERTFEVQKRLETWFKRAGKYNKTGGNGTVI